MKLFFLKSDSLYNIFKTIEKVDRQKKIEIFIESWNQFFLNERWWKQIKELLDEKEIDATFIVATQEKESFLLSIWLQTRIKKQPKIKKFFKLLYSFFFNIQYFHIYFYQKKHYLLYLIFIWEISIVLIIFYFLYSLILPSTTITVYPFLNNEPIVYNFRYMPDWYQEWNNTIPTSWIKVTYHTGSISYTEKVAISTNDLQYLSAPAEWTIRLVNKTNAEISLVEDTELVTDDGLLFKIKEQVNIPAQIWDSAWFVNATARARTYDQAGKIIWERWSLKKWDKLYIKKLASSLYKKDVYAEVSKDFTTISESDFVSWKDKSVLSNKMNETISTKKIQIVNESVNPQKELYLPFDETITLNNISYSFNKIQENSGYIINGEMKVDIHYTYIKPQDLQNAANQYLNERSSDTNTIITINTNNISFLTIDTWANNSYIIPTKINIVQAYDFNKDHNWLKNDMRNIAIDYKNIDTIKQKIVNFEEIANVTITNKPFRNNSIASTKSRIFINVENP